MKGEFSPILKIRSYRFKLLPYTASSFFTVDRGQFRMEQAILCNMKMQTCFLTCAWEYFFFQFPERPTSHHRPGGSWNTMREILCSHIRPKHFILFPSSKKKKRERTNIRLSQWRNVHRRSTWRTNTWIFGANRVIESLMGFPMLQRFNPPSNIQQKSTHLVSEPISVRYSVRMGTFPDWWVYRQLGFCWEIWRRYLWRQVLTNSVKYWSPLSWPL